MAKPTVAIYGIKDWANEKYPTFCHDHNLCIMQDGEILQYLQLERYTRRKYDNRLDLYLEDLIANKIIELPEEFDFVCANDFTGNAFISKNGCIHFEANSYTELPNKPFKAKGRFFSKEIQAYCCPHELAHIFATLPFYGDLLKNSLLVSFDGMSSLGNYSAFVYSYGSLTLIDNNEEDLGFISKFFNDNALTFRILGAKNYEHCSVPGKLMGFASFGKYNANIEKWLKENNYFNGLQNYSDTQILESIQKRFGNNVCTEFDSNSTKNSFLQDVACTFQHIFENAVLSKLEKLQSEYHCDNLYYGGGCALNIVTNTKIVESDLFENVFIAPCCNDSGLSIGAATYLEMQKGNRIKKHSPYLNNVGLSSETIAEPTQELIQEVAKILLNGGIVGVCNGYGEAGPRALGNRSLLALPNDKELAKKLSMEVKKREWYRPIAPVMLQKLAQKVSVQDINPLAKFMLSDFEIKHEFDKDLCGVIHENQTARIQTIESESDNAFIYNLLTYLHENNGILGLINTSFNAQGEPIVHTKEDAFSNAKKMNLSALVYNNNLISKENFSK